MNDKKRVKPTSFRAMLLAIVAATTIASAGFVPAAEAATNTKPINISAPSVSGATLVGQSLTANLGKWSPKSSLKVQWFACNSSTAVSTRQPNACNPIARATSTKFVLTKSQLGSFMVAGVAAKNAKGTTARFSRSTKMVMAVGPSAFKFDSGLRIGKNLAAFTSTNTPTTGKVPVVKIYFDYACPFCHLLLNADTMAQMQTKVSAGDWVVEFHPISFLDRAPTNQYSSRAANSAACVASLDPDHFFAYNSTLFANQPSEGGAGPDNAALIAFTQTAGVAQSAELNACINNGSYSDWVSSVTTEALTTPVAQTGSPLVGTPLVVLGGQVYTYATVQESQLWSRLEAWVNATFLSL